MTNRHKIYAAGIAMVVTAGLVFAQAVGTGGQAPQRMAKIMQFVANYLDLTDAQKTQAQTILQQAVQDARPLLQQLRQGRQTLAGSVKTPLSDKDLQNLANAQGQAIAQLIVIRTKTAQKLYGILTPAQQAKADQLREMAKGMMQRRMHGAGL